MVILLISEISVLVRSTWSWGGGGGGAVVASEKKKYEEEDSSETFLGCWDLVGGGGEGKWNPFNNHVGTTFVV